MLSDLNIHPLMVHFPIAILSLYAVAEILRFRALTSREWWFNFRAVLVIVGAVAALVTIQTGTWIGDMIPSSSPSYPVLQMHALMATSTGILFCVLALIYIFAVLMRYGFLEMGKQLSFLRPLGRFCDWLVKSPIVAIVALIGLCTLILTGTLGGILVYGPDLDPATKFVYQLLF
jgi:uncharacterized membrane protein